jgi:hypothetical protein
MVRLLTGGVLAQYEDRATQGEQGTTVATANPT